MGIANTKGFHVGSSHELQDRDGQSRCSNALGNQCSRDPLDDCDRLTVQRELKIILRDEVGLRHVLEEFGNALGSLLGQSALLEQ